VRAERMPTETDSVGQIETKAKPFFPLAMAHASLTSDRGLTAGDASWKRFEIPSQDKAAYLKDLAHNFTPNFWVSSRITGASFCRAGRCLE